MSSVTEPSSGLKFETDLKMDTWSLRLLGASAKERKGRKIYAVGLYVDPIPTAEVLRRFYGQNLNRDEVFYEDVVTCNTVKALLFQFPRELDPDGIRERFRKDFAAPVEKHAVPADEFERLLDLIAPEQGFQKDHTMTILACVGGNMLVYVGRTLAGDIECCTRLMWAVFEAFIGEASVLESRSTIADGGAELLEEYSSGGLKSDNPQYGSDRDSMNVMSYPRVAATHYNQLAQSPGDSPTNEGSAGTPSCLSCLCSSGDEEAFGSRNSGSRQRLSVRSK